MFFCTIYCTYSISMHTSLRNDSLKYDTHIRIEYETKTVTGGVQIPSPSNLISHLLIRTVAMSDVPVLFILDTINFLFPSDCYLLFLSLTKKIWRGSNQGHCIVHFLGCMLNMKIGVHVKIKGALECSKCGIFLCMCF